jgi:hypothetical protein
MGVTRTKEESLPGTPIDEVPVREAENFHYAGQLFLLIFSGEYGKPCLQLCHYAT